MAHYALVLGGGGVTGIARETGLLHGLREQSVDLTDASSSLAHRRGRSSGRN